MSSLLQYGGGGLAGLQASSIWHLPFGKRNVLLHLRVHPHYHLERYQCATLLVCTPISSTV